MVSALYHGLLCLHNHCNGKHTHRQARTEDPFAPPFLTRNLLLMTLMHPSLSQVAELCAAATAEVGEDKAVRIANYLCPGNYAVSGSAEGCDAVERLGKSFKARMTVR